MSYRKVARVLALAALASTVLSCAGKVVERSRPLPSQGANDEEDDEGEPGDGLAVLRASVFFDPVQMSKRCTEVKQLGEGAKLSSRIGYEFLRKKLGDAFPSSCTVENWSKDQNCSGSLKTAIRGEKKLAALAELMRADDGASSFSNSIESFLKDQTDLSRPVVIAGLHLTTWLEDRTEALADNLPFAKGAARVALQVVAAHIMSWAAVWLVRELEEEQGVNPYDVANRACEYLYAGTTHGALSQRFLRTMVVRLSNTKQPGDLESLCNEKRKGNCREKRKALRHLGPGKEGRRPGRRSAAQAVGLNPVVFGAFVSSSTRWEQIAEQGAPADDLAEFYEENADPGINAENPDQKWIDSAVDNLGCALDAYESGALPSGLDERRALGDLGGVCAIVRGSKDQTKEATWSRWRRRM